MTTKWWRLNPILGEPVKLKESGTDSAFTLQVERAARGRSGILHVDVELWNGDPLLTRTCVPARRKELNEAVEDILAVAPELDEADLRRTLTKLAVAAGQQEPEGTVDHEDEETPKVLSLCPPGFVCVARDAEDKPIYVLLTDEGTLDVTPAVEGPYKGETVIHVPPPDLPWLLPSAAAVLRHWQEAKKPGWAAELLQALEQWHRAASDLGLNEAYLLLADYVMATYVPELVDFFAELLLESDAERGKTRTGQAAIFASRHGMHVVGLREASLLRDANDRQAALFIDLKDLWAKAERNNCEDVILCRFEKGAKVERVLAPDAGPHADTTFFDTFGPTIIGTNTAVDDILETRTLAIDMPFSRQSYEGRIDPQAALPLVERLMAWRARMLARGSLPAVKSPAGGRLGDILRPLQQVLMAVDESRMAEFDRIVEWQTQRRHDKLSQSREAAIVKAVAQFAEGRKDGDELPTQDVHTRIVGCTMDVRTLGRKLRKMGWTVQRVGHTNVRCLIWDTALLERQRTHYGLDDEEQPNTATDTGAQT
jgi:hypothetical protein